MTIAVSKTTLVDRAPQMRPEIAASIMSAVTGNHMPVARITPAKIPMIEILRMVSRETHVGEHEIRGPSRFAHIVRARMLYAYLCRYFTKSTMPMIGRSVSRDHSTINHAIEAVRGSPKRFEPELSKLIAEIEAFHG